MAERRMLQAASASCVHGCMLQMHAQMMCTGRKWCDFVSFDDRLPPDLAYFKKRIHFDEELAREIESEVKSFLADLESEIQKITERAA